MTEPSDTQREPQAESAADPEREAIQDLEVTGDDADRITGGEYLKVTMTDVHVSSQQ